MRLVFQATGHLSTSGTVQPFASHTAENIKSMVTLWVRHPQKIYTGSLYGL